RPNPQRAPDRHAEASSILAASVNNLLPRLRPPVPDVPGPVRLGPARRLEEPDRLERLDARGRLLVLGRAQGQLRALRVLPADEHLGGVIQCLLVLFPGCLILVVHAVPPGAARGLTEGDRPGWTKCSILLIGKPAPV